jgi:cytochrome c
MEKRNIKMVKYSLIFLFILSSGFVSAQAPNTLTKEEISEGWKLLFDGKTMKGWRNYKKNNIGAAWKVKDGALHLDTAMKEEGKMVGGGDIVTEEEYENFELSLEWKIQACGNSGILFNVQEGANHERAWHTGPEMQVLDNSCHPDARITKHRAGDLYDLISCTTETVKPAGEWNLAKIVSRNGTYEFWLNGVKNVEFTMRTPEWKQLVANSKFKSMPDFGKFIKGRISLQDHGDQVWYRNIKIKVLKS